MVQNSGAGNWGASIVLAIPVAATVAKARGVLAMPPLTQSSIHRYWMLIVQAFLCELGETNNLLSVQKEKSENLSHCLSKLC